MSAPNVKHGDIYYNVDKMGDVELLLFYKNMVERRVNMINLGYDTSSGDYQQLFNKMNQAFDEITRRMQK